MVSKKTSKHVQFKKARVNCHFSSWILKYSGGKLKYGKIHGSKKNKNKIKN